MTPAQQLKNLKPGEVFVYFIGPTISRLTDDDEIEARDTAHLLYRQDKIELVARLKSRIAGNKYGGETGIFEYIAIGKHNPPDPVQVAGREFYNRGLIEKSKISGILHGGYVTNVRTKQ